MAKRKPKKTLAALLLASSAVIGAGVGDAALNTAYNAQVVRIVDSDTLVANITIFPGLTQKISIRSIAIDTAEKFRPNPNCKKLEKDFALEATAHVATLIKPGDTIRVTDVGLGKYAGRVVGNIFFKSADKQWLSLSQELINRGFAYEYWGKTKRSWCDILGKKNGN